MSPVDHECGLWHLGVEAVGISRLCHVLGWLPRASSRVQLPSRIVFPLDRTIYSMNGHEPTIIRLVSSESRSDCAMSSPPSVGPRSVQAGAVRVGLHRPAVHQSLDSRDIR